MVQTKTPDQGLILVAPAGEPPANSMVRNQIYLPEEIVLTYDHPSDQAVRDSVTALQLLQSAAAEYNLRLNIQTYDFGSFVSEIETASSSSKFAWLYYINGESAQVGADQYALEPGDLIEWKYEVLE